MKTGPRGLALIKRWESLRLKLYQDSAGLSTIGWGHLIKAGETFTSISAKDADTLLVADLSIAEQSVTGLATTCRQSEFDALTSFTFNLGAGRLEQSTLLRLHNAGERLDATLQFTSWIKVNGIRSRGLLRRRLEEAALYLEDA